MRPCIRPINVVCRVFRGEVVGELRARATESPHIVWAVNLSQESPTGREM